MFKPSPHMPGKRINRTFHNYTEYQENLWQALDDFYFADLQGYGHTRMPSPDKIIEPSFPHQLDFSGWKERVIERWKAESRRDPSTKGIEEDEIPENLWYYLYERFLDCEKYYSPPNTGGRHSYSP